MWNNIGRKLQGLAMIVCFVGIIASIVLAIVVWNQNSRYQPTVITGILYMVIGCLASWIGSWAMYGLGIVVEHVENGGTISNTMESKGGIPTSDGGVRMTNTSYWICPKCKTRNPFSKIECKECGTIRQ